MIARDLRVCVCTCRSKSESTSSRKKASMRLCRSAQISGRELESASDADDVVTPLERCSVWVMTQQQRENKAHLRILGPAQEECLSKHIELAVPKRCLSESEQPMLEALINARTPQTPEPRMINHLTVMLSDSIIIDQTRTRTS